MSRRFGPCMCGATDCPSCGPAQGYTVVRVWRNGRYVHVNPENDDDGPDEDAADSAADRYERDIDAMRP